MKPLDYSGALNDIARSIVLNQLCEKYRVPRHLLEIFDNPWDAEEYAKRYQHDVVEVTGRVVEDSDTELEDQAECSALVIPEHLPLPAPD